MNEPGEKRRPRVVLRQVAQRAGVSLGTASNVFAGKAWVSPEARAAVLSAAADLGYQPRQRRLAEPIDVSTIGLIVRTTQPSLTKSPFYSHILHGAERACAMHGISLMYAIVDERVSSVEQLPPMIQRRQVQGLLVVGYFHPISFTIFQSLGIPFVTIDHRVELPYVDSVTVEDEYGGYLATKHLIDLGHRHPLPALIAGPLEHTSILGRLNGYRRALAEGGLTYDPHYVRWSGLSIATGHNEMQALLDLPEPPTGVFCCTDLTALGALNAVRERKIAVPQECSIVGYDDGDMAAHAVPPLTTIRSDKELLAIQAVRHLLERIESPELVSRHTQLGIEFVERMTTAPPGSTMLVAGSADGTGTAVSSA